MRWENGCVPKSPQDSQILLLTEKIASLEKRLEALEMRDYQVVEADGTTDLSAEENRYREGEPKIVVRSPTSVKRGRRPRMTSEEFQKRRDGLLQFLEIRWNDLSEVMREPRSLTHLVQAIDSASPGAQAMWEYQQLTEQIGPLWEFLESGRYKGKPLQIANAIAGVPEMTWRSSLDRGTKYTSDPD
jgi:hypothetical protein